MAMLVALVGAVGRRVRAVDAWRTRVPWLSLLLTVAAAPLVGAGWFVGAVDTAGRWCGAAFMVGLDRARRRAG